MYQGPVLHFLLFPECRLLCTWVGAWMRSTVQVPHRSSVCKLFSSMCCKTCPWCWGGLHTLCWVTQHSPDDFPTTEANSPVFPRALPQLGPGHPAQSPEGRILHSITPPKSWA